MKFRNNATSELPEPYQEWYINPYLESKFKYKSHGIDPTKMESRISLLYALRKDNIMPWMWDHENYMDENKDMYGYFYPEDIHAILQIAMLESEYKEPKQMVYPK